MQRDGRDDRLEAYGRGTGHASERRRKHDDVRPGLRIAGFQRRATIAFTVTETRVTILRLFHGGPNWEARLDE